MHTTSRTDAARVAADLTARGVPARVVARRHTITRDGARIVSTRYVVEVPRTAH